MRNLEHDRKAKIKLAAGKSVQKRVQDASDKLYCDSSHPLERTPVEIT